MCGICGFRVSAGEHDQEALHRTARRMADTMTHRGPDDSGTWADSAAGIAFGFRRLSIQDLSEAGLTIVVFFAMAYSGWTGGHIAVDLIGGVLKGRALQRLDMVSRFICGAFFAIVTWQTIRQGLDVLEYGEGFNLIDLPHYPFYFVVAFGSGLYSLVLFVLAWRSARGLADPKGR